MIIKALSWVFAWVWWTCFLLNIFLGVSDYQGKLVPDGHPFTPWTTYIWLFIGMFGFALLAKIFDSWAEKEKRGTPRPNKRRGKEKMVSNVCGEQYAEFGGHIN